MLPSGAVGERSPAGSGVSDRAPPRDAARRADRPRAELAMSTDLLVFGGFIGAALLVVHLVRTLKPWERWALLEGRGRLPGLRRGRRCSQPAAGGVAGAAAADGVSDDRR